MHVYKNTNNFLLDVMPKSGTSNCLADSTKTYYSDGYKKDIVHLQIIGTEKQY